jgi:hypothetical protein
LNGGLYSTWTAAALSATTWSFAHPWKRWDSMDSRVHILPCDKEVVATIGKGNKGYHTERLELGTFWDRNQLTT